MSSERHRPDGGGARGRGIDGVAPARRLHRVMRGGCAELPRRFAAGRDIGAAGRSTRSWPRPSRRRSGRHLRCARECSSRRGLARRPRALACLCRGAAGCAIRHRQRARGLGNRAPRLHLLQRGASGPQAHRGERNVAGLPSRHRAAILHGAMAIYLARYLNVPPARLPGEGETGSTRCRRRPKRSARRCWMHSIVSTRSRQRHASSRAISRSVIRLS